MFVFSGDFFASSTCSSDSNCDESIENNSGELNGSDAIGFSDFSHQCISRDINDVVCCEDK
jgi:hypothetical protein